MHGPTFPRGGLAATFAATVMQLTGTPSIAIGVEHKDREDTSFSKLGSFAPIHTTGTYILDLTGIKEEFRFCCDVTPPAIWEMVHLRMIAPIWRPHA